MLLLLSDTNLGIYAAPIAMLTAFMIPIDHVPDDSQLGSRPIEFPYLAMSLGDPGGGGDRGRLPLPAPGRTMDEAAGDRGADAGLVRLALPAADHPPVPLGADQAHHLVGAGRRSALHVQRGGRVAALKPGAQGATDRGGRPHAPRGAGPRGADGLRRPMARAPCAPTAPMVRRDRPTGRHRGRPARAPASPRRQAGRHPDRPSESELDGDISLYLFSDQPVAVRLRKMRQLLTAGADRRRASHPRGPARRPRQDSPTPSGRCKRRGERPPSGPEPGNGPAPGPRPGAPPASQRLRSTSAAADQPREVDQLPGAGRGAKRA